MVFSHCSGPADPALAMGTRVAAAESGTGRGQRAGATPGLGFALLRSDGMQILNHAGIVLCHDAQVLQFCTWILNRL